MPAHRNLLLVLAQGWRSDTISDAGVWPVRTPNLERLAGRGLRAVATSASPSDAGGMASLLTGLHARQHGRLDGKPSAPLTNTCAHWLAEAGYHVAGVGAVEPIAATLDDAVVVEDVATLEPSRCAYWNMAGGRGLAAALRDQRRQRQRVGPCDPVRLLIEPDEDVDGFIGQQAAAMLARMPVDKPWALFVVFTGPGNDLPPPTLYDGVVDPARVQRPFTPANLRELNTIAEPAWPRALLQRLEPFTVGRIRADYLGRVSLLDHAIGRLTDAVRERLDADRTWTLAAAAHGHLLGEHGLLGRRSFLAPAIEVPLLIAPPEGQCHADARVIVDGLVSTVDLAPTVAALGAADAPASLAGRSLLPMLQGDTLPAGDTLINLSEFNGRVMVETERHKAVFDRQAGDCISIYDLFSDPRERRNLVGTPRGVDLIDAMRLRLAHALLPLHGACVCCT